MRIACGKLLALLALAASAVAFASDDRTFDKTVAAQPHGVVDISNVAGSIAVSGWDRQEVRVHAEFGAQVERVDVSSEGGRTTVKVVLPNHASGHGEAELRVDVPRESEVDVSAVSADIKVNGVQGIERLNTVSGDVSGALGGADAEVKTVSGEIRLKGHGAPARLQMNSVSGDVRLEHGAGDFEGTTVSGALAVTLDSARSVRARTTSGDMRLEAKLARGASVEATSVSGEVSLRGSADGGYAYEVSTFSGDISDCFGVQAEHGKYMPGSRLQGSRAEGAGHVRIKTMSGDVQLCDR
ncbi:MAG: DUF4097 family beta strand repeat protein [Gammaproteobacteria bacterium]|nr:DUF4097 family beta strand repeat protein [Gammaproteobacteria bacterium]